AKNGGVDQAGGPQGQEKAGPRPAGQAVAHNDGGGLWPPGPGGHPGQAGGHLMSHRTGFEPIILKHIPDHSHILEVGPGRGGLGWWIKAHKTGCHLTGVEVWPPYVKVLEGLGLYDRVLEMDVRNYQPDRKSTRLNS